MKELFDIIISMDFNGLFIKPTKNNLIIFVRYAFVGGIAFLADYFTFTALTFLLSNNRLGLNLSVCGGFVAGLICNFILSKKLVFTERAVVNKGLEFIAYGIIGIVGLALNILIVDFFVFCLKINKYISKAFSALIVLIYNYAMRKLILYRGKTSE